MKENLHDIDKLFKDALDDHEEVASAGVWDAIDKNLDKNKVVDINRKYIQLKRIAAVLLILLLGAGVYTLNTLINSKEQAKITNRKNNAQNNSTVTLTDSQNKEDKIIASNTKTVDKNQAIERSNNNSFKNSANNNELDSPTGSTGNQSLINSGQKGKEILTVPGGGKIIFNRRSQKTILTNADYDEEENGPVNTISIKKVNVVNGNFTSYPGIYPDLPMAEPAPPFKQFIITGINILPRDLITYALPGKIKNEKKAASFSATVFFAPNISSNHFKDDKHEARPGPPGYDRDKIRNGDEHQSSSSFGVLIDYNMNNHWSLQSGISLSNKTIRIKPKTIYADVDNNGEVKYVYNCSSGYLFLSSKSGINPAVGDSIQAFESTNTLQYASVPLAVKYNYSINKIDLFGSIGTSLNILTNGKIETGIENGPNKEVSTSTKINGLKPGFFGGNISVGASYSITGKIAVSFLPSYNFALTSGTKVATAKSYPNTISLAAGIRYKL